MGICNTPAMFQRAMNVTFQNFVNKTRLTQGMINLCVIVYMDDILVYSETYHGHAQHIKWTLGALRDAGFKIVFEKSEFFLSEISFLGYVVTRGGLRPDSRKVAAVKDAPVPTLVTQVRAFLGLASYYRRLIKGFAVIARPLMNLLRKDQFLNWDAECEQAFATLKGALVAAPILIWPDPTKQIILITDWQPEAISVILAQKENDGREHVIRDVEHHAWFAYMELLIIQEWRTEVEGNLFLFGSVRPGYRHQIVQELTIPLAQLVDDLPLDIILQCDESPIPHVFSRALTPYLYWSACLEELAGNNNPPSQQPYMDPRGIIDLAFFQPRTASKDEVIALEEEEEEDEEGSEEEDETREDGSYSEHNEGEQSDDEEEDDKVEDEESEWETLGEEADRVEGEEEDLEAVQKREEIAADKRQLEYASEADLPISNDPAKDPKPPKPEDGDLAAETSSGSVRRRRSRSPSPSTSARPPIRALSPATSMLGSSAYDEERRKSYGERNGIKKPRYEDEEDEDQFCEMDANDDQAEKLKGSEDTPDNKEESESAADCDDEGEDEGEDEDVDKDEHIQDEDEEDN
ncbi:hypothetical protein CBR_g382 [Chara braunii]|uniref:Reverse transcriptase domain-containing protein n=1 Tax=Chara braunii TaxID=69332 RepID=A0A388JQJ1_CHABU|nr:hypothetical protein CBR_g382 [Chara braunii]|eukprot:GBG60051.1 hypothetical protein CBR_g382 [Chara braunii]